MPKWQLCQDVRQGRELAYARFRPSSAARFRVDALHIRNGRSRSGREHSGGMSLCQERMELADR
jgi:hypothetical protein